jgi:hypothetical protein
MENNIFKVRKQKESGKIRLRWPEDAENNLRELKSRYGVVNLFLCITKYALRHEGVQGS